MKLSSQTQNPSLFLMQPTWVRVHSLTIETLHSLSHKREQVNKNHEFLRCATNINSLIVDSKLCDKSN